MHRLPSVKASACVYLLCLLIGTLPVEASISTEDARNYYDTAMLLKPEYRFAIVCVIILAAIGALTVIYLPIMCWRRHRRRKRENEKLAGDQSWQAN